VTQVGGFNYTMMMNVGVTEGIAWTDDECGWVFAWGRSCFAAA